MKNYRRAVTAIIRVTFLVLGVISSSATQNIPGPDADTIRAATVFVVQTYDLGASQAFSCIGSGTLISPTGLILTNAHLVEASGPCIGTRILIALPTQELQPPILTYQARIAQIDRTLDIAILEISAGLDGSPINPKSLNLPFVSLGDSAPIQVGAPLSFAGFPDLYSDSAKVVGGNVSSFVAEPNGGQQAWIRIDDLMDGAMSGGGAYDGLGNLVGILTGAPRGDGRTPGESCLITQDTNNDLTITNQDRCIPVAAPISIFRPINYALPMIESARRGLRTSRLADPPAAYNNAPPSIDRLFFSTGVNQAGNPSNIVYGLPTGSSSAYLFFDYLNMRAGTVYELQVTRDGLISPEISVGPLSWGGGENGIWYIGTPGILLPDGIYEYTLLVDGQEAASSNITVGTTSAMAEFRDLTFTASDSPNLSGAVFPSKTTRVTAQFSFADLPPDQDWTEIWYLDRREVFRNTRLWDLGPTGTLSVSATNLTGLPQGTYRLELLIGQRLAATGEIVLMGTAGVDGQPVAFSNIRVTNALTLPNIPDGQTGPTMPLGTTTLYLFYDWDLMPSGLNWSYRWFLDGRLVSNNTYIWAAGSAGQNYWVSLQADNALPEGTYAVEVLVQNTPMFSTSVTIGSGTQAVSSNAGTEGDAIEISGTVTDALTGDAVPGALIAVLNVKFTSAGFSWNEAEILSQATSDQRGHFILSKALPKGQYYTVYVFADGYLTIVEDFFTVLSGQSSPVEISIQLNPP